MRRRRCGGSSCGSIACICLITFGARTPTGDQQRPTAAMKPAAALLSGAAGAISLNLMHECTRKTMPHPPRVDIVGMRAVASIARATGHEPPSHLRNTALVGDLAANTLYYSLAGLAGRR